MRPMVTSSQSKVTAPTNKEWSCHDRCQPRTPTLDRSVSLGASARALVSFHEGGLKAVVWPFERLGKFLRNPLIIKSRGGQIRTDDFLLPKQALYQAELRPVRGHPW